MADTDFRNAGILELNESLKSRKLSAQELAKAFGASKETLKLAKLVDGDLKRERFRGPLQGIPFSTRALAPNATSVARVEKSGGLRVDQGVYSLGPDAPSGMTVLRPTYGLISRHGLKARAWTLDTVAITARDAQECGVVLQTAAGGDKGDPGSAGKSFYFTPRYARPMNELRVGYVAPAEAPRIAGSGAPVAVKLPDLPYAAVRDTIVACEAASLYETDPLYRAGLAIPARDYLKAQRIRTMVQIAFRKIFSDMDALVLPDDVAARLAGLPIVSLGSFLIAGPAFSENTLLALCRERQKSTA